MRSRSTLANPIPEAIAVPSARTMRICALGAAVGCAAGLTGCHGALTPVFLVGIGTPFAVGSALALPHGPTVTIDNQADVPADVRLWVARIDALSPEGCDDRHTGDAMAATIPPGEVTKLQGGDHGWTTGQTDGIVWVRIDAGEGVHWFEFARPGPYRIELRRADVEGFEPGPVAYLPASGQAMTPLPESLWIERHDGRYPITASPIETPSPTPDSDI